MVRLGLADREWTGEDWTGQADRERRGTEWMGQDRQTGNGEERNGWDRQHRWGSDLQGSKGNADKAGTGEVRCGGDWQSGIGN
jgi:hypothetical protein